MVEDVDGLLAGAVGLAEATLGRGLLFAAVGGRGFSLGLCGLGPDPPGGFDDVLGGWDCGAPKFCCIGL